MALTPRLELRQTQRLALTPTVRTRLAVLRMGPLDLAEEVAREAARNPFLVYDGPRGSGSAAPMPDFDLAAEDTGFQEDLRRQISLLPLAPQIAALAEFLVGELREDGMLDTELTVLAEELGLPLDPLDDALQVLQSCEPAGIGARTLPECLRLQLIDKGLNVVEAEETIAQLSGYAQRDWAALEQATGLSQPTLEARADLLRGLTPRPIVERPRADANVLRPDLTLERLAGGEIAITIDQSARPRLRLDEAMVRRAESDGFAPEFLSRARALIEALDQRGHTLSRIGDWLAENQTQFFFGGPEALLPGSRVGMAADLALHPSTVSRAVSGKSIDVDGRLWPLSVFFSSALAGAGGPVSARAVHKRIADLIAQEKPDRPWSDETLVEKLRAEGIDIARRTVAKYRQGLRIPSSSARRRLAKARLQAKQRE